MTNAVLDKITQDRVRTNLFKKPEQELICFLVMRIPAWISSNMLTFIGFIGSIIISSALILARYNHKYFLFIAIFGFFVNWFGDSLDGRLAYFRNKPRKWYGFTLDFLTDWLEIIVFGAGYIIYLNENHLLGFVLISFYAWSMMQALIKYLLTGQYIIDAGGLLGPTEVRIALCIFLCLEYFFHGAIVACTIFGIFTLLIVNLLNFNELLNVANQKDQIKASNAQ